MGLVDDPQHWLRVLQSEAPLGLSFTAVLGSGRSAVVYEAASPELGSLAVKVYDQAMLQRFGSEVQLARLQREVSLKGHGLRDLVQVHDGGELAVAGMRLPYLAMELVDGSDLRERVSEQRRLSDGEIRQHLGSLFRAADFLQTKGLCHRDIKVDNCRLRHSGELVLLDLGVLRPTGASDLTDAPDDPKTRHFLGTLRYAPPEYLVRREMHDEEAWKAVTIYQIGATLYEMIHGVLLFAHVREPYAELVESVLHSVPQVMRSDIGQDLIALTRCCLVKDPVERLKLVPWERLRDTAVASPPAASLGSMDLASMMRISAEGYAQTVEAKQMAERRREDSRRKTAEAAHRCVHEAMTLSSLAEVASLPVRFVMQTGGTAVMLRITENLKYGFPFELVICCRVRLLPESQESAVVQGVGIYGALDLLGREPRFASLTHEQKAIQAAGLALGATNLQPLYETLVAEPPAESWVPGLRFWVERMVGRYFELTRLERDEAVRREQERVGQNFFSFSRSSAVHGYNTERCEKLQLGPHRR